ncbi:MAG: amidohydrolase family protein [Candidatus Omnitrophica bacterium]|nr:amidohydrolase family protein [Candidatus Omnitrophota bacterium]
MIIDAHVHLDLRRFKSVKKAASQVVEDMDKACIDRALLLTDNYLNKNEHIEEACELFPHRFYGIGMVNPKQNKRTIKDDIDRLAEKKWFKGLKLHPRMQGFTLDEKGVSTIASHIAAYDLPLIIDCLPVFKFTNLDERNFPNAFDRLAKANPHTKIVIAHMGGHRLMDAFGVARGNPNIYLEVSYTFHFFKGSSVEDNMAYVIKNIEPQRIIYGSDHPSIGLADGISVFNKFCDKYKINTDRKKFIYSNAISRLIHLHHKDFDILKKEKNGIIRLYENRLKRYGISIKTMGWRDRKQQNLRFRILSEIGNINKRSILDVGCGFGDLYNYLADKNIKVKYSGFDIAPKIVQAAKNKHSKLDFRVKDILRDDVKEKYDYVFASGILNKKISNNLGYAKKMIAKMYKFSKCGIAVNMFTTNVDFKEKHLYYYPTEKLLGFARTLSRFIVLRPNFPLHDFTLYIYKKEPSNQKKYKSEIVSLR